MDKLLAMSILSWGPHSFGCDGKANGWSNPGWMGKKNQEEKSKGGSGETRTSPVPAKKLEEQQQKKSKPAARFAVELDGLHCFETIVPK